MEPEEFIFKDPRMLIKLIEEFLFVVGQTGK